MKVEIYSIYDEKVDSYSQPFFCVHKQHAIRIFSNLVNDKSSNINTYPEDFALYFLGSFDDATGLFDNERLSTDIVVQAKDLLKEV